MAARNSSGASSARSVKSVHKKRRKRRASSQAPNLDSLKVVHGRMSEELATLECIRRALSDDECAGNAEAALRLLLNSMNQTYDHFDSAVQGKVVVERTAEGEAA